MHFPICGTSTIPLYSSSNYFKRQQSIARYYFYHQFIINKFPFWQWKISPQFFQVNQYQIKSCQWQSAFEKVGPGEFNLMWTQDFKDGHTDKNVFFQGQNERTIFFSPIIWVRKQKLHIHLKIRLIDLLDNLRKNDYDYHEA